MVDVATTLSTCVQQLRNCILVIFLKFCPRSNPHPARCSHDATRCSGNFRCCHLFNLQRTTDTRPNNKTNTGKHIHLRFAWILIPGVSAEHHLDQGGNPRVDASSQMPPLDAFARFLSRYSPDAFSQMPLQTACLRCLLPDASSQLASSQTIKKHCLRFRVGVIVIF